MSDTQGKATPSGPRGKAAKALKSATSNTADAAQRAVGAIESNPLAVLAGGLAVGIAAGALLPRGERERKALAPVGRRLAEGATAAFAAAKETGKERLNGSILTREAATESARKVLGSALSAAKEATSKPTPKA